MATRKKMTVDLLLQRIYLDDCTISVATLPSSESNFRCVVLERPYLENENFISCIPPGAYTYFTRKTKRGTVLQLNHVVNRTGIQCHLGNWVEDSVGCLLPGRTFKPMHAKGPMVTNSGDTMAELLELLPSEGVIEIK